MFRFFLRYRLFFSVLIALGFLVFTLSQYREGTQESAFQSGVQSVVYPFQSGFHSFKTWTLLLLDSYVFLQGVEQENRNLKQEISVLKKQLNRNIEDAIQFRRLRSQMSFAQTQPDELLFAEIVGESMDNTHQTLSINRGSQHGVKHNASVILREGVVGRIQSVSPQESSVQIILDRRSTFPALVQRSRVKGIVTGTHSGLELRRIHPRADIQKGDRIVTSGLGRLFSKGLMVGIVTSVKHEEHELFKTAQLDPALDFTRMEEVFVVLKKGDSKKPPLFSESSSTQ